MAPVNTVTTIDTASGKVGYILFNDHNLPSEGQLVAAVQQLKSAGIIEHVWL